VVVEQVAGTTKEDEGTLRHLGVLQGQALWIAARVVAEYRVELSWVVAGLSATRIAA
jgi:hypothetical protein